MMKKLNRTGFKKQQVRYYGRPLGLASSLLIVGFLTFVTMTLLHPGGPANNHRLIFAEYAASLNWNIVHLGQFTGMGLFVAGLVVLCFALNIRDGGAVWAARLGRMSAALALGLYGVLQAVDGVALKQAVDSWVTAPGAESGHRFADAEVIRWIEWGTRSYQTIMLGFALVLLGSAVAFTARLPKVLGFLMGLSGLTYFLQGWVLGFEGFSETNTVAILAGYCLSLAWTVWLAVIARRQNERPSELSS